MEENNLVVDKSKKSKPTGSKASLNPGQNICNKIVKSNKNRQEKKCLVSIFGCFF